MSMPLQMISEVTLVSKKGDRFRTLHLARLGDGSFQVAVTHRKPVGPSKTIVQGSGTTRQAMEELFNKLQADARKAGFVPSDQITLKTARAKDTLAPVRLACGNTVIPVLF